MNKKIKIEFVHDEHEFGPCLGITRQRHDEIKDLVWKVMHESSGSHKQSELIETMQDKLGGTLTAAEMFSFGISFGVAMYIQKDIISEPMQEILKNIDNIDINKLLNKSAFVEAMKNEEDDF
jgi:hypothetical protein